MTDGHWKRLATSWVLLAAVLLAAGVLIALIGSTVFPQAMMFAWAAIVLLVFLLIQLLVFRVLGLRSRADEQPAPSREHATTAPTSPRTGHADPDADAGLGDADSTVLGDAADSTGDAADAADAQPAKPDAADREWRAWRG